MLLCVVGQGLLHISDMSYDHVAVPEDKVNVGDVVRCKIKEVNKAKQRIGFSLKLMEVMLPHSDNACTARGCV